MLAIICYARFPSSGLLPLKLKKGGKLAIIGPAANDTFRLCGNFDIILNHFLRDSYFHAHAQTLPANDPMLPSW